MSIFDEINPGARIRGLDGLSITDVVSVVRFGPGAINLVFRSDGHVRERLLYRGGEQGLELIEAGQTWSFYADPALLRLVSEAYLSRKSLKW